MSSRILNFLLSLFFLCFVPFSFCCITLRHLLSSVTMTVRLLMNEELRRIRMVAVLVRAKQQSGICVEVFMTIRTDCPRISCKSSKHTRILALTLKQMDPFCELIFTPFCCQHPYKTILSTRYLGFSLLSQ
jgi:hypothetical protein